MFSWYRWPVFTMVQVWTSDRKICCCSGKWQKNISFPPTIFPKTAKVYSFVFLKNSGFFSAVHICVCVGLGFAWYSSYLCYPRWLVIILPKYAEIWWFSKFQTYVLGIWLVWVQVAVWYGKKGRNYQVHKSY